MNDVQKKIFACWLTGLSGAGKTTIAKKLFEELKNRGVLVHHLDGDEVRARHPEPLGFSKEDRDKNIAFAVDMAKEYQKSGISIIASFISPYREHRELARRKLQNFIEIFVDAPIAVCEERDFRGLYKKARTGEISSFTGVSDPYEKPTDPEIHLHTDRMTINECVKKIITYITDEKN